MSFISSTLPALRTPRLRNAMVGAMSIAALSLATAEVHAQAAAPQVMVSLAGLDLAQPGGAREAYSRLRHAAQAVCPVLLTTDVRARQRQARCYSTALTNAVASVNNAGLTALLQSDRTVRIAQHEATSGARG